MQTQRHGLVRDGASLSGTLVYGVNEGRSQPIKSTTQLSKPIAARRCPKWDRIEHKLLLMVPVGGPMGFQKCT